MPTKRKKAAPKTAPKAAPPPPWVDVDAWGRIAELLRPVWRRLEAGQLDAACIEFREAEAELRKHGRTAMP